MKLSVGVLSCRETGEWVACALEVCLVAQGHTEEEALENFQFQLSALRYVETTIVRKSLIDTYPPPDPDIVRRLGALAHLKEFEYPPDILVSWTHEVANVSERTEQL